MLLLFNCSLGFTAWFSFEPIVIFFCKSAEIWQDFVIIIFLFISSVGSLIRMPTRKVAGRGNKSAEAKAKQLRKDIKEKLQIRSNIWH